MRGRSVAVLAALFVFILGNTAQAWYWYPSYTTYRSYPYSNRTSLSSYSRTMPQKTAPITTRTSNYSTATAAPKTATTATTSAPTSAPESTLLSLLNKERTSRGLKPLILDASVSQVARAKSREMVSRNYFSHTSPTYGSPSQMLTRWGISYRTWAENIARASDAYRIHASWMASSAHRANILKPSFTHVGIGTAPTSSGGYAATQLFIGR